MSRQFTRPGHPLIVMDIGDVLIRTRPMAHYRSLSRLSGMTWEQVAEGLEGSGAVAAFERGHLDPPGFLAAAQQVLRWPGLSRDQLEQAWNEVVAGVDDTLAPWAARLAAAGQLRLASNINPFHWRAVSPRLADQQVTAPAWLSYEIGHTKPNSGFFTAVVSAEPAAGSGAVYIDDRPENVEAAVAHGMLGWLHRSPEETAGYLADLLS